MQGGQQAAVHQVVSSWRWRPSEACEPGEAVVATELAVEGYEGVLVKVRIVNASEAMTAKHGTNPIEFHLCAPEQQGNICNGYHAKRNLLHVKASRWEVVDAPAAKASTKEDRISRESF